MFQVRIHGRGGQGVVTAAELLSVAAFTEGKHAQAFPSFGSERMGAPVVAFCRIDDREIRSREPIVAPAVVIIQDPTLLHVADAFSGLAPTGYVLINSARDPSTLGLAELEGRLLPGHIRTIAATELALAPEEIAKLDEASALTREYPGWMLARTAEGRAPGPKA